MAIAFDATSEISQTTGATVTWTHTNNGDCLIVGITNLDTNGRTVNSVTYNSVAMTLVGNDVRGSNRVWMYRLVGPATGANSIVVTYSGTISHYSICGAVSVSGVDQSSPIGDVVTANAASTSISVSLTPVTNDNWGIDVICTQDDEPTVTGGQTERLDLTKAPDGWITMSTEVIDADPEVMSYSVGSNNNMCMVAAELKVASAPGGLPVGTLALLGAGV